LHRNPNAHTYRLLIFKERFTFRVAAATEFVAVALLAISEEARLYMVFLAMSNEWNQDKRKKGLPEG